MSDPEPDPEPRESLGERLRSLGYLQDPLVRFLSGSEKERAGFLRTYLTVGAKVGVLVGFLFFALISTGYLLVGRYVLLDLRDVVVLFFYLLVIAILFGFALGILFAGGFALYGRLRRRSYPKVELAARKAALACAVPFLLYLLLLWSHLRLSLLERSPWTDVLAAAVCVLFTLLVARLTFHGALFLAAWSRPYERLEHRQRWRGVASLVALLLVLAGAFVALRFRSSWGEARVLEASAFEPRDGSRVLWIGIDGLELEAVRELVGEGHLPTFEKLLREGVVAPLKDGEPVHPLRFWADVTTGRDASAHGVTAPTRAQPRGVSGLVFVERSATGFYEILNELLPLLRLTREEPLSASQLRQKSYRELIEQGGHPFHSVNWWLTHPLDPRTLGETVTERAAWIAWGQGRSASREHASTEVSPSAREVFEKTLRFPDDMREMEGAPRARQPAAEEEWLAEALDETAVLTAESLLSTLPADARGLQVGFWGANALYEALAREFDEGFAGRRAFARRMEHHYRRLDRRLARLLEALPDGGAPWTVCLTAASSPFPNSAGEALRSGGFLLLHGSLVARAGRSEAPIGVLDVVPTLLMAAGYPISEEMEGRAQVSFFEPSVAPWSIESYGTREILVLPDPAQSAETLRMLKTLGYL